MGFSDVPVRSNSDDVTADFWNALRTAGIALEASVTGLYDNDQELDSDDLPNTTTVYGYNLNGAGDYDDGDFVGSKALTESGTIIAADDVLGNERYCGFNGSSYLYSSDSAFNFTGDFTLACWVYRASWAAIATGEKLISRESTASVRDGWVLGLGAGNDEIYFQTFNNSLTATSYVRAGFTNLSAGWHHIAISRDADAWTKLYIDGLLVCNILDTSQVITAAGNLEIGSGDGGGSLFTGRMDEIVIHNATIYTDDQIARLYCRSARRYVAEIYKADGTQELYFKSPLEGQVIPFYPLVSDNAGADLGSGAGGFDVRECTFSKVGKFVKYEGIVQANGSVTAVDTALTVSLPLQSVQNNYASRQLRRGRALMYDGSGNFDCIVVLGKKDGSTANWMYFHLLQVDGTYGFYTPLVDTIPTAWADNDEVHFEIIYLSE